MLQLPADPIDALSLAALRRFGGRAIVRPVKARLPMGRWWPQLQSQQLAAVIVKLELQRQSTNIRTKLIE